MVHKPTQQEAILMVLHSFSDDRDVHPKNKNNEFYASQITKLVGENTEIKRHPRSNYYSLCKLLQKGFIQVSRRETLEDSHINARGRRTYYKLTESGRKLAQLYLDTFQEMSEDINRKNF